MSRLNAMIKLVVMTGEAIFLFVALTVTIVAALIISGKIIALDFHEARRTAIIVCIISAISICCSVYGFCGIVNQIVRKGCFCRGRRILCFHQCTLLAILILSVTNHERLTNREKNMNMVIGNVAAYPTYDSFERILDKYFSNAYFEANCASEETYDRSSKWLMTWVDTYCPVTMRREKCTLSNENKAICDTSCLEKIWDAKTCCPSEVLVSHFVTYEYIYRTNFFRTLFCIHSNLIHHYKYMISVQLRAYKSPVHMISAECLS